MDRKPLFDTIRTLFGRLSQPQVAAIDAAINAGIDHGLHPVAPEPISPAHRLGTLSERYECGSRGPGAVSSGRNDPGGVSYGLFQLASRTGTCAAFMGAEGRRWQHHFDNAAPGSAAFSTAWRTVADQEPEAFAEAQRAFIARTHYHPAVTAVKARTGLDLDAEPAAIRDAAWSTAVQHGGAVRILAAAVERVDTAIARDHADYARALIDAIYAERSAYVRKVAANPRLPAGQCALLESLVTHRFAAERADALAMLSPLPFSLQTGAG